MDSALSIDNSHSNITPSTETTTPDQSGQQGSALHCWGSGEFGQHGQGHNGDVSFLWSEVSKTLPTTALGAISDIACGASHTVLVTESGEVYVWGNGNSGQLGCGDQQSQWKPTALTLSPPLPQGVKVRTAACGSRHTLLLLDNGRVYGFGNNTYAQLGFSFSENSYAENQLTPCYLKALGDRRVSQVACGESHSLFLFEDGRLAAAGNNEHGQMGDGICDHSVVPREVALAHRVTRIACGANHNLVVTDSGDVYTWGYGKACGKENHDVTSPEKVDFKGRQVIQVSGGSTHSLALTAGGKVYSWGCGEDGQLGLGSVVMATTPRQLRHFFLEDDASSVACGDVFSAVITVSGRLYMWGRNSHMIEELMGSQHQVREPSCMNPEPLPPLCHVVCGSCHAAALTGWPDFVHMSEPWNDEVTSAESEGGGSVCDDSALSSTSSEDSDARHDLSALPKRRSPEGRKGSNPKEERNTSALKHLYNKSRRPPTPPPCPPPSTTLREHVMKTKLTLGEFYAITPDSFVQSNTSTPPTSAQVSVKHGPVKSTTRTPSQSTISQSRTLPLLRTMSHSTYDSKLDINEPLPVSTKEDMLAEDSVHYGQSLELSSLALNKVSRRFRQDQSSAQSRQSKPDSCWFPEVPGAERPTTGKEANSHYGDVSRVPAGQILGGGAEGWEQGPSRLSFSSSNYMASQVNTSPANKSLPVQKDRNIIASRKLDILDANQLMAGSPVSGKTSLSLPGRPYGMDRQGLTAFRNMLDGLPTGFEEDGYPYEVYPLPSAKAFHKDTVMQHIPTFQLDGDFGMGNTKTSRYFGALSGQQSKRPTKFFKKPAPIGHLSKTTSQTSTPSDTHTTLPEVSIFSSLGDQGEGGGGWGGGGGGRGMDVGSKVGTRGLGVVASPGGHDLQTDGSPPAAVQGNQELWSFSTASSRQNKSLRFFEDLFDVKKSQSAPSRRKRVSFADERSNSVAGNAGKGTLASAVSSLPSPKESAPNFMAGNSRVTSHIEGQGGTAGRGEDTRGHAARPTRSLFESSKTPSSRNARTKPTFSYRTLTTKLREDTGKAPQKSTPPRSGTLRTMFSAPKQPTLNAFGGQAHSRSQLLVSGGRTKRAHFD